MNGARLIYLMGASGSGKDTLLRRCACVARADEPVIVAHRYITRDSGASETLRLSEDEFRGAKRLALPRCWSSHGLRYGIGVKWMPGWPAARRSSSTVRAHTCLRRALSGADRRKSVSTPRC